MRQSNKIFVSVVLIIIVVVSVVAYFLVRSKNTVETTAIVREIIPAQTDSSVNEANSNEEPDVEEQDVFVAADVQDAIDEWVVRSAGNASVTVLDSNGGLIASANKDSMYFAASIYKLYVAYFGYQQVDQGVVDGDEVYVNGYTRLECLDRMIRESDSPCAEKLWVELGKERLTDDLKELGAVNTSMTDIRTTSYDAAVILERIWSGKDLSDRSKNAFLASMKAQIYRDALNEGFSSELTVYNKIGFRELDEYHDVAIVEVTDDRRFIVSVLTSRVGTRAIADLATQIESVILE